MTMSNTVSVTNLDTLNFLDKLHVEQKDWHDTLYASANAKLLALLKDCLIAYKKLTGDRATLKAFAQKLTELGIPFNGGTHLTSRIVRYVFRINNSRSAAYARVLRAAIEHSIDAKDLAGWVIGLGGIEGVRRLNKKNMTPGQQLIAAAEQASEALLKVAALATISEVSADLAPDASAELPFALALVRANDDAGYDIVYCTRNASLVRRALALVPKDFVAVNANLDAAQQQTDKLAQAEALAAQAATSVATPTSEAA